MRRPGNWLLPGIFRDVVQGGMRIARRTCMRREGAMFRLIALRTAAAVALALSPAAALADASAAVVVADDGGLEVPAVRAIRAVTAGELRKRGVPVSEDVRQEAVQPVDARLAALLQEIGVTRLFVVRIGGRETGGLGGRLSAGVELFRLHGVRLLGGVDAVFPFFSTPTYLVGTPPQVRTVYPMAHLQLGF